MLFNSYIYMFAFLPIAALVYSLSKMINTNLSKIVMVIISLYFYSYMSSENLAVLACSCAVTYGAYLAMRRSSHRKLIATFAVLANALALCYFKYIYFIVDYANIKNAEWMYSLGLPLAVSFFTFQQISFIVDSYKGKIEGVGVLDYLYYISFFPKLIAGPITRYSDLMFQDGIKRQPGSYEILAGLMIFSVGLFKKVVLSGHFALIADHGYSSVGSLTQFDAWITSLSYTMQIYFDFSGYSDMAIGTALLLGIRLPVNFNSPYKSINIREFWERWHISLSTWLRDYVYIPLGGSRVVDARIYFNVLITFIVSGAWHGSGINFLLWGLLHGVATCISRAWTKNGLSMPSAMAWMVTFLFINFSWIPFRAKSFDDTWTVFKSMVGINGLGGYETSFFAKGLKFETIDIITKAYSLPVTHALWCILTIVIAFIILALKNSNDMAGYGKGKYEQVSAIYSLIAGLALTMAIICMLGGVSASQFIYAAF
ncbi:MBOAT family protein [Enterobacter hormaechei]|uniref:MBOAT family O-acyltransferase n=2 Tax=Enterobacter hormaechei TaxID=158836 RepID=UPI00069CA63B